jgi:uncharacterized membrane protein YbhN (UPF0104 family)
MINYLVIGLYMKDYFPSTPQALWIVVAVALVTGLNILGIRLLSSMNFVLIAAQFIFIAVFAVEAIGRITGEVHVHSWTGPFAGSGMDTGAVFAGAAVAVLYLMALFPNAVVRAYEWLARRIAPRLEQRGGRLLRTFVSGLGVLRRPTLFGAVLWWTVLHWLLNAVAFWLGFLAVGVEAPFRAALFLQGLIAIGVALPAAPGFFGVFEFFAKAGLGVYGVRDDRAVAWAIAFHFLSFIPITVIGAWYFARLGLHMREIGAAARR